MTIIVMLPLLNIQELARFCKLNKTFYQLMLNYVNFEVLFKAWHLKLTTDEVDEIKISSFRALQVAAK